jgi:hypothetical protein
VFVRRHGGRRTGGRLGGLRKSRMGCGETAIGVDTVSPGMIRNCATVDSGGNAGLPGRQALHTQASSTTLSQQPHPPREVDATWHLPPVFIFLDCLVIGLDSWGYG